jgi:hypothetical protein
MQMLWCWRCKCDVPMLNEEEYAETSKLYGACMKGAKEFRERFGVPLKDASIEARFKPVCDRYEQMTGMKETNANAIMHHRLALYGPPCRHCQKPLRSPKAKLCGSCMTPVAGS